MLSSTLSSLRSRLAATFAGAAQAADAPAGWLKREEAIMGTAVAVELWADSRAAGEAAMAAVMEEMRRIDRTMSPHKADSQLSQINRDAGRMPVHLSDEMCMLIARAIEFSRWSDGAFDISYASAGQLYDYRAGVAPDDAALTQAREAIGWQQLLLNDHQRTLRFGKPGMRIDLGGFAKGHAVDRCIAILRSRGITNAMVSAGGDSHVLGDRRGRPWMIAVRDPRREGEVVALLPLQDTAVSTSGDYERFFEKGGVRHHHLLDPRTGRSPSGVRSVTIMANDGLTSEALSKTVFVLGAQRGMALINSLSGVDAVIVDATGLLHYSSGLLRHA